MQYFETHISSYHSKFALQFTSYTNRVSFVPDMPTQILCYGVGTICQLCMYTITCSKENQISTLRIW